MIHMPAGEFVMGEGDDAHSVYVDACYVAEHPVTNSAYQRFVEATERTPPRHWSRGQWQQVLGDHPVVNVSWHDAVAYCRWLTGVTGQVHRLLTEAEWEKAARGPEGHTYPWGSDFDDARCNCWEAGIGRTTRVDAFPSGSSPYGVMDMCGNVWEWCSTLYAAYPYCAGDGREDLEAAGWRVLRGGSWYDAEWGARAARRLSSDPGQASHNTGFRVGREP